jgi:hypothetical protein
MLITCLSLFSSALAGGLAYSFLHVKKLRKELADQTRKLELVNYHWANLDAQAQQETGMATAAEAITTLKRFCGALGSSLHNYGHSEPLSEKRRQYLGAVGYVLKDLARRNLSPMGVERPAGPQVMGWVTDARFGTGVHALREAPEELRQVLDGLTLYQLIQLTTQLLEPGGGEGSLTKMFARIGICLLTPDGKSQAAEDERAFDAHCAQWAVARDQWDNEHPDADTMTKQAFAREWFKTNTYKYSHFSV